MTGTTYAQAGVSIELGDDVSKILYNAAKQTWQNRRGRLGEVIVPFDDFSGTRAIDVSNLPPGTVMNMGFDGVGTKIEAAERCGIHRTVAYDLFAMVCDDAVVRGAEPVLIGSILDVNSLGKDGESFLEEVRQLAEGYICAAREANVAIINGEVAELGQRVGGYGKFNYNWGAAVVWFAKRERMFTGREIQQGDYLVGLREEGFRSNGLSLVRKIMEQQYGEDWHAHKWEGRPLAEYVLTPSRIYTTAVVAMFGGYDQEPEAIVHGVVHITGGGVPGKLGRVLKPSQLGATVDNLFDPNMFMAHTQRVGKVSDREAYNTWNMGQGMIVITPDPDAVTNVAREYSIEARVIGQIDTEPGIRIKSKGEFARDKMLIF